MRILVDWDLRCVDVWTRNESKHNVSAWHHQNQLQVPQEARIWSSWFRSMLCDKDRNWKNINLEYRMLPVSVLEDRLSLTVMLCFRKAWLCWLSDFVMFEKSLTVMSACYVLKMHIGYKLGLTLAAGSCASSLENNSSFPTKLSVWHRNYRSWQHSSHSLTSGLIMRSNEAPETRLLTREQ